MKRAPAAEIAWMLQMNGGTLEGAELTFAGAG